MARFDRNDPERLKRLNELHTRIDNDTQEYADNFSDVKISGIDEALYFFRPLFYDGV